MLKLDSSGEISDQDWNALVETCGGNPLHFPLLTRPRFGREKPLFLRVAAEDGNPVACGLAYVMGPAFLGFRIKRPSLYLPTALAIRSSEGPGGLRDEVYAALLAFARDRGFSELTIDSRYGDDFNDMSSLRPHIAGSRLEFVMDCQRAWEDILAGMSRQHRKIARRVERDISSVETNNSLEGLLKLRDLQQVSARRSVERGAGFHVPEAAYFRRVYKYVLAEGFEEIVFAKRSGDIVGGLAYVVAAKKALTVRSGMTDVGYDTGAMYLLQNAVFRRAKERGLGEVNLGAVPEAAQDPTHSQHGLFEFKRGFGAVPKLRTGVRMTLS